MRRSLLIFDLDGTLIDSAPDLRIAVNNVLGELGAPALDIVRIRSMIGDGAVQLLTRAFAASGLALSDPHEALQRFFYYYQSDPIAHTRLYDGVIETLALAREHDVPMAVCTNKPEASAHVVLERLGLAPFFQAVVGGDTHAYRKPDPRMLTGLLERFGASAAQALMVGDSEIDAAAARAAAVPFALLTYGYHRGPVAGIDCEVALDRFPDLAPIIAPA